MSEHPSASGRTTHRLSGRQRVVVLLSPFVVMATGHLVARVMGAQLGAWAWVPVNLALWSLMLVLVARFAGHGAVGRWWARRPMGWRWPALALAVAVLPLPLLLMHWRLLLPWYWLPWLLFAVVNAPIEEAYWRGLLLEAAGPLPRWVGVVYTSAVFAVNHPISLGVNSEANATVAVVASTFVMGLAWAVVFHKTASLRWPIIAHVLVDLFNLSVPVFLNLYIPGRS
jgi:membrane protease YdiL (CAAX protease family)